MEFNIRINFSDLLLGELENILDFFQDICYSLSSITMIHRAGINIDSFSDYEKNEYIKRLSKDDYTLNIDLDYPYEKKNKNRQVVSGLRVIANSDTPDCIFFRSAMIFEIMGAEMLAHNMRIEFYTVILNDMLQSSIQEAFERNTVSEVNSKKASLPRHKCFNEVIEVIRLTWENYPGASQTGLHEALCSHYYGRVSRNSLLKWISESGFRPEKPNKFTRFELVFPQ